MAGTLKVNGKEYTLSKHEYLGVMENINLGRPGDPDSGTGTVLIDDIARKARVQYTARNVKVGDTVVVEKTGKVYRVTARATYTPPPQVTGSMGTPPQSASTVSGSNLPRVNRPSTYGPTDSIAVLSSRVQQLRNQQRDFADLIDTLNLRVNALQSALNTNASRTNQVRDYASNAGSLVEPVVDVLKDEGMARD